MRTEEVVPHDDPILVKHYSDLMATQPKDVVVIKDESGTYRFKSDSLVRWLIDTKQVDLNEMCIAYQRGKFTLESYMAFYRGSGYSLSGFCEIFGEYIFPTEE